MYTHKQLPDPHCWWIVVDENGQQVGTGYALEADAKNTADFLNSELGRKIAETKREG